MDKIFNKGSLEKMIQHYKDDEEALDIIYDALCGFEEYHQKIINMEIKIMVFASGTMDRNDYQQMVKELDKKRTIQHNSILTAVRVLNRLAEQAKIEPVYTGIVAEERPFRREVANAILDLLQEIIENRR